MNTVINIPETLPAALGTRKEDVTPLLMLMGALKLFECGKISSGLAAELSNMSRIDFLMQCSQYGVSIFQQTPDEILCDTENTLSVLP